ncbi:MAG: CoA transferase [SAR202 cluster bacterium]|nr:CoA transferase [SAR202 cluster bacterium]
MNHRDETNAALTPYKVLDLTEGGSNWCGRVLADLGADVIKVEPPEGSPTRLIGPFFQDKVDREHSLFWYSYCLNKRGVTLDLESTEGRNRFRELAVASDIVLESFEPGYLDGLGLGYDDLSNINPAIVVTSITPFGQTGPYAHYKATDIVGWSMGGMQWMAGDEDRPPVRISVPQAELHAGAQGAAGSMAALWHSQTTGEGQHVDVSMQTAVIWTLMNATPFPPLHKVNKKRGGPYLNLGSFGIRTVYPCKNGHINSLLVGGVLGGASLTALVRWMSEEDMAPAFMQERDWMAWDLSVLEAQGEEGVRDIKAVEENFSRFFLSKTKAELFERAFSDRILVAPCNNVRDILEDPQLEARDFWTQVHHPSLGRSLTYPGAYIKLSETPIVQKRPAPAIGEHNDEVFGSAKPAKAVAQAASSKAMAFEGLKVLDLTWVGVGPITIKYLADNGADVIHVESVTRPDVLRTTPPFKDGEPGFNRSQFPASYNTSKHGLGLNLARPESRELIRRIIAEWQPDVISESFTPRAMRNWGLDYESVREIKPDIVYFSTCLQGQTGPRALYAGYGGLGAALAGFYTIAGWPDRDPTGPYGAYSDFVNPPNAVAAIIAALDYKRRTGKGQHLDLAQYEAAIQYLTPAIADYVANGRISRHTGNADDSYAPHGVYRCKDESRSMTGLDESRCAIAVTSDEEWEALCKVMGSPELAHDERFSTIDSRQANSETLDEIIGHWTSGYEAHEVMRVLQGAGVPAGAVQNQSDLWDDPQLKHRDFFQWLDHTECGPMPYDGLQFLLSKTPGKLRMPHALVGEHNELILKKWLKLSDDEITELIVAEALEVS